MKQRFIDDLHTVANTIESSCIKLAQINQLQNNYHGGETLTLSLKAGDTELSNCLFNANGKAMQLEDLFKMLEDKERSAINEAVNDLQTILDVEGAE